jgi:hypothetical protein
MEIENPLQELRTNVRLRLGLWLIAAIVGFYGILALDDYRQKLMKDYQSQANHLMQLQSVINETQWQARVEQIRALKVPLEEKLWKATSKGLAQANLQTWLDTQAKTAKLEIHRLTVEEPIETKEKPVLWQISAQMDGVFVSSGFENLLLAISQHPQWVIVERLDIQAPPNGRFTLVVTVYFQALSEATP